MMAKKKITPKSSSAISRQLRMIHPTLSATASDTRHTPSTTKNAIVFRRLAMRMMPCRDCNAVGVECSEIRPL